jgi:hypothetical protein
MDNQENIPKNKKCFPKAEEKLSCNGKVWMRVEENSTKRRQKSYCTLEN